jgi:hypothetical protein
MQLTQEDVKYLGHKHIFTKQKQLGITLTKIYWLLGHKSKFCTSNKLLIYETIFKPLWTNELQLWGTASTSNIEIVKRFQTKAKAKAHDSGRSLVRAEYGYPKGSLYTNS